MAFKGITFNKQLFTSKEFALIIHRFFNEQDGIVRGMAITNTDTNIIISPGYFISSGHYTKITSEQVIPVSTNGTFTLVYEIDLSQTNTEELFNQGLFKLISTTPQKDDLFGTGEIYQCELATVEVTAGIITSLTVLIEDIVEDVFSQLENKVDKETGKGLSINDFNNIYKEKLDGIIEGATKNETAIITGTISLTNGVGTTTISYPTGYTKDNCVPISYGCNLVGTSYDYGQSQSVHTFGVRLLDANLSFTSGSYSETGSTGNKSFKIVLMKIA